MAHFAKIVDTKVVQVIVVHNNEAPTEAEGKAFIVSCGFDGEWVQTSYNATNGFRKQYAGIGFTYDPICDEFVAPQPYPSWTLDDNNDWQPPTPKPEGEHYWSEEDLEWVAI